MPFYGYRMAAILWLSYGDRMATVWLTYGYAEAAVPRCMAIVWLTYGDGMATLWLPRRRCGYSMATL